MQRNSTLQPHCYEQVVITDNLWFQIKLTTSLLTSTLHMSFAFTVHSETPQLKVRTLMKLICMLLKPTHAMYMISLTLFEMNCWFPCDQGHVINRPPTMQISLLEWTDSQIRRPAIQKSGNYKINMSPTIKLLKKSYI